MTPTFITLDALLDGLLRTSWQAAVLVGMVLLVQRILGRRLTAAWRYRLWLLVVLRLVLPFQPASSTSVHNLARLPARPGGPVEVASGVGVAGVPVGAGPLTTDRSPASVPSMGEGMGRSGEGVARSDGAGLSASAGDRFAKRSEQAGRGWTVRWLVAWVWLVGVVVFALRILTQNLVFLARLRRDATPVAPEVGAEVEGCRRILGLRVPVRALETGLVLSPAVHGLWRPTVLLPRGLAAEFSLGELRHVLLHELAHVKRGDLVVTWMTAVLQVVHWFNPVMWVAFARMRADRELACDELVLSRSRDGEAAGYGETLLRMVEVMSRGTGMTGLVGILEDRRQMSDRIRRIAAFRRPGRASALAALVLVMLGWVGLTDAAPRTKELPPVVPLRLTNLLVEAENRAWLEEDVWKAPPRGSNGFGGITFHFDGLIQLSGTGSEGDGRTHRDRVMVPLTETVEVDGRARVVSRGAQVGALHLVGGTAYDAPAGTKIAEVVWRYADGTFKRTPILYGVHLRDWWRAPFEQPARLPGPHVKVVWRGAHEMAHRRGGRTLRLYRLSLANPEPRRVVRQLELVSARARPAMLILAMTLDPLKPGERPDDTPDLEAVDPEWTGRLNVTVQDTEGQPIPGAEVRVTARGKGQMGDGMGSPKVITTDSQGMAVVLRPSAALEGLQIAVSKPDFGMRRVVWNMKTGDTIPDAVTVTLRGAIRIGGTVVDPEGNPVAGARVSLYRYWTGGEMPGAKGDGVDFERQEHTTGEDGRWSAGQVPPEILHRIGIAAEHPDYIAARAVGDVGTGRMERLKEGTYELRLGRGLEVRGRVLDRDERPIPGATVWAGGRNTAERKETRTDGEGGFEFRNVVEGPVPFSVLAQGHEPATQTVKVGAETAELVFRLGKGSVIRARVQNAEGEPLSGTRVDLEGDDPAGRAYEFATRTDGDGRFEWDGAPPDPMQFYFYAPGYEQKRNHVLRPGEDNVVVMKRARRVVGRVLDESTGEPVTRFKVAVGRALENQPEGFYADHPGPTEFRAPDGSFEVEVNEERTHALQTEAEDYASVTQSLPGDRDGEVKVTVQLKRSSALRGVVVDAAGRPAPGAQVTVTALAQVRGTHGLFTITLKDGRLERHGRGVVVEAVDGGRFVVPSPPVEGVVVAVGPSGFATATVAELRASGRLTLVPYGRIEGTLTVLGQPMAGEEFLLNLSALGVQAEFQDYKATTGPDGRFVIERVPAGEVGVVRLIPTAPGSWAHGQEVRVTVHPGQTSQIALGGTGRALQVVPRL